ncbi:hypothetical protein FB451DRAFT_1360365 [Mycena latifolia]|nr:hypothetical protein FB451DRAFT_1360365 [Mycena latifolia]
MTNTEDKSGWRMDAEEGHAENQQTRGRNADNAGGTSRIAEGKTGREHRKAKKEKDSVKEPEWGGGVHICWCRLRGEREVHVPASATDLGCDSYLPAEGARTQDVCRPEDAVAEGQGGQGPQIPEEGSRKKWTGRNTKAIDDRERNADRREVRNRPGIMTGEAASADGIEEGRGEERAKWAEHQEDGSKKSTGGTVPTASYSSARRHGANPSGPSLRMRHTPSSFPHPAPARLPRAHRRGDIHG